MSIAFYHGKNVYYIQHRFSCIWLNSLVNICDHLDRGFNRTQVCLIPVLITEPLRTMMTFYSRTCLMLFQSASPIKGLLTFFTLTIFFHRILLSFYVFSLTTSVCIRIFSTFTSGRSFSFLLAHSVSL